MKKIIVLVLAALMGCSKKISSISTSATEIPSGYHLYGYYSLPKTALKIVVPVTKNVFTTGLLADVKDPCYKLYVENHFGWEIAKAPDSFSIEEKIIVQPLTLPDPQKSFALVYRKAKTISQTINISISKDGLIQSGEFAQESKVYEIAKKSVELGASILGSVATGTLGAKGTPSNDLCSANPSTMRVAQLVADAGQLYKAKYTLLVTPVNSVNTPEVVKYHLQKIEAQLKTIKEELLGKVTKTTTNYIVYFEPIKDKTNNGFKETVLLKYNPKKGVLDSKTKPSEDDITLSIRLRPLFQPKTIGNSAAPTTNASNAFLYYNLPAKFGGTLFLSKERIASFSDKSQEEGVDDFEVYFPQLGSLAYLPNDFKETNVVYFEDTGGLKSAKFVKNATLDAAKLEELYKAADSLRTSIKSLKAKPEEEEKEEEKVKEQVIRLIIQQDSTIAQ